MKDVMLTGIKPTGTIHIGNYFGAIKPAIEMSKQNSEDTQFYFIANYHALTTVKDKQKLEDYTHHLACAWLACGLDPKKIVFYKQSDISEIFELTCILSNVTPKGLMNRAHSYKALTQENIKNNQEEDVNINMGLYNYPILMSADILLFNTKKVPVGQDQKQHIEIARDIAKSFNKIFGKNLVVPKEAIKKEVSIIEGLDGRKMSKSYGNIIPLFASSEELKKIVSKIKTNSKLPNEPKDTNTTVFKLYKLFATDEQINIFEQRFKEGISWAEAKNELFKVMDDYLEPIRQKYNYYYNNKQLVEDILSEGAIKAKPIAKNTLERVKKAVGA